MNNIQIKLNQLPIGRKGSAVSLESDGMTRRRMLDLGIVKRCIKALPVIR